MADVTVLLSKDVQEINRSDTIRLFRFVAFLVRLLLGSKDVQIQGVPVQHEVFQFSELDGYMILDNSSTMAVKIIAVETVPKKALDLLAACIVALMQYQYPGIVNPNAWIRLYIPEALSADNKTIKSTGWCQGNLPDEFINSVVMALLYLGEHGFKNVESTVLMLNTAFDQLPE